MPRERDEAWQEVSRRAGELGSRIRGHYEAQRSVERPQPPVETALTAMTREARIALGTAGEALRDQELRDQAIQTSRALADALEASMAGLGGEVKQARKRPPKRRDR
jgi:hypothetical protein